MTPTTESKLESKSESKKKIAPLATVLTYDRSLQVRGGIDPKKVEKYRQIIRESGDDGAPGMMDPIVVFFESDNGPRWIADGLHRIEAYQAEKAEKISVIYREGSKSKALRFALGENGHHGGQMTNAEKRHAAEMAVVDAEVGNLPDKQIAFLIGCSPSLISDARRGETPAAKAEKVETRKAKKKAAEPEAPSGNRETESPAPREATARERAPKDVKPTKSAILKQIQEYVDRDQVDEQDIIDLFTSANAAYCFAARPGQSTKLKIVGKSGRPQLETEVVMKSCGFAEIVLRYEGDGKIKIEEA